MGARRFMSRGRRWQRYPRWPLALLAVLALGLLLRAGRPSPPTALPVPRFDGPLADGVVTAFDGGELGRLRAETAAVRRKSKRTLAKRKTQACAEACVKAALPWQPRTRCRAFQFAARGPAENCHLHESALRVGHPHVLDTFHVSFRTHFVVSFLKVLGAADGPGARAGVRAVRSAGALCAHGVPPAGLGAAPGPAARARAHPGARPR